MPENVRHAIDLSKKKNKNTDFFAQLTQLNDKIDVYKTLFYQATPTYEKIFQQKRRERLIKMAEK